MPIARTEPVRKKSNLVRFNGHQEMNVKLDKYFTDALKDGYWAVKHLARILSRMQKAATTDALRQIIEEYIAQSEVRAVRLERVFNLISRKPQSKKCDGMEGLIREAEIALDETDEGSMTRDAAITISVQKSVHYEMAAYSGLIQLAKAMEMPEAAALLNESLEEIKKTEEDIAMIGEEHINWKAELVDSYIEGEE